MTTGAKPKTETTERSNSPAVMRSVMASAMRPSSTVKVSVLETLSGETKAGLIAAKIAISRIRRTRGPNSGAEMKRRRRDVCVKSGPRRKGEDDGRLWKDRIEDSRPGDDRRGTGGASGLLARHHLVI